MIDFAETRETEATKVKKRRSKGFARRAVRKGAASDGTVCGGIEASVERCPEPFRIP